MSKIKAWKDAKIQTFEAEEYIGLIGKTTKHSTVAAREGEQATAGRLTSLSVGTQIHFQPTDGAINYHGSKAFDVALSKVVERHWDELCKEALELLRKQEREAAIEAKAEVEAQLSAIEQAMAEKS
ncbi:MAG: hypothetical protein GYB53_21395 [Rhodobacteraceae bacterium]|nr:hypothetical protein [Paracoccaceae bacterium]MBR9823058.1 hypothetical protein [Paracoccaceae bacterium]